MPRRLEPSSWRGVFLRVLGQTGNVTLSAERAQAARSFVYKNRRADAGFALLWQQALTSAEEATASRDGHPPAGARHANGLKTVITRTKKRQPQIARAHKGKWTPGAEKRFLDHLAATANVTAAAREAGFARHSIYARRLKWPAFREQWDAALESGYARLEMALVMNASNFLDPVEADLDQPIPGMTIAEAVNILKLHRAAAKGGHAQGYGWRRQPTDVEALKAEIVRKARLLSGRPGT